MSAPLVPSPLDYIGRRPFALYPPIGDDGPNEWLLGSGSWAEVQFVNAVTGMELWVPRTYIGGVSDRPGLPLVVELTKELDRTANGIAPKVKEVIELPLPSKAKRKRRQELAPVVGIRIEQPVPSTRIRAIWLAVALIALAALVLAATRL